MKPQITPPLELIQEWACMLEHRSDADVFTKAAQWGADQELQACINFVYDNMLCDSNFYKNLRDARRPKPPTLKEQALDALELFIPFIESENKRAEAETIRKALEALPND